MVKKFAELQTIEHNEEITGDTHYEFLYHLKKALLLALRERGRINAMQYRHAEELLKRQRRDRAKMILKEEADQ